jgi:hypothetical protein
VNLRVSYIQINERRTVRTQHTIQKVRLQISSRRTVVLTCFFLIFSSLPPSEIQDSTLNYAMATSFYILCIFFKLLYWGVESKVHSALRPLIGQLCQPRVIMMMGKIGGMISRGNRNTRRKPAPVPLCPPQTPHAARTRTRAAAVGCQRLTA